MVVTRYFGGTKLGTGGLVHAYSDAAKTGLKEVRLAQKTFANTLSLTFAYKHFDSIKKSLESWGATVQHEVFAADVQLLASVRESVCYQLIETLLELTSHQAKIQIIEYAKPQIMPLTSEKLS